MNLSNMLSQTKMTARSLLSCITTAGTGTRRHLWNKGQHKFKVLEEKLDIHEPSTASRIQENMTMEKEFREKLKISMEGGGKRAIERHTKLNKKVLVRDRLNRLLDENYPFLEISALAGLGLDYGDVPCAGNVLGIGSISGQLCVISASDATVKGGTVYPIGVKKQLRAQQIARENHLPCVYIIDSGGAYLPLQSEIFIEGGKTFYNEAVMSAAGIPQVCIVAGSCTAGAAYIPTMADEAVIIDQIGTLFLGGPPLVQAATGEVVTPEDLGGAKLHCDISGCTDYFSLSEDDAIETGKNIMASLNMPTYVSEPTYFEEPLYDTEELQALAIPYDGKDKMEMYKVIARIFDGSRFQEFKPRFGPSLITGFARIYGMLVGIIASNGPLTTHACLKGAHFVEISCQRHIPLVFFQNTQTPRNKQSSEESADLINARSKMMSTIATANVPKITFVVGNGFGIDNFTMCGRGMGPRFLFLWPGAEVAIDDPNQPSLDFLRPEPDSSVSNIFDVKEELWNQIRKESSSYYSTARLWDDGIILPQQTRKTLGLSLLASVKHCPIQDTYKSVIRM